MKGEKVVVPISGGIVSTTLLYYLNEKEFTVLPITFNWKQFRKTQAIEGIKRACKKLNLPIKIVNLGSLKNILEDVKKNRQVMMNRDVIYISIAMAYALTSECPLIYFPFYLTDPAHAPQIGNYVGVLRDTFEAICAKKIHLAYDFWMNEQWEILDLGATLGVDFNDTWSCYYNGKKHCGRCLGCLARKEAFEKASIKDNTSYLHKTPLKSEEKIIEKKFGEKIKG